MLLTMKNKQMNRQQIILFAFKPNRLLASELKEIRKFFKMSLRIFGKSVTHSGHSTVAKWERSHNKMHLLIEFKIRLFIIERLMCDDEEEQNLFYNRYKLIKSILQESSFNDE